MLLSVPRWLSMRSSRWRYERVLAKILQKVQRAVEMACDFKGLVQYVVEMGCDYKGLVQHAAEVACDIKGFVQHAAEVACDIKGLVRHSIEMASITLRIATLKGVTYILLEMSVL
jgi:transcription initiation factor TFIIIB Brf1 subunit/transcription initiation factor TFIIB